jgi:hypothetical protein
MSSSRLFDLGEKRRQVLHPVGDDMNDAHLVLQLAGNPHQPRTEHQRTVFSKTFGQTMTLATPVSSSSVMKMTPLAEPGLWRTSTSPATSTCRPDAHSIEPFVAHDASCRRGGAQERDGMRLQ